MKTEQKPACTPEKLKELGEKFPSARHFAGSVFQNYESEVIVIQTLHAAGKCLEAHGEAFSFRCDSLLDGRGLDGVDNKSAYLNLVSEGYFLEQKRKPGDVKGKLPADLDKDGDGFVTLIFMTDRLIMVLEKHGIRR